MRKSIILLMLCFVAANLPLWARDKQQQADALDMILKAREISNIRAEGSPPFRLQAAVQFVHLGKEIVEGKYLLVWAAPDKWREETTFPDFREVRARDQGVSWHLRNRVFEPFKVEQVSGLMAVLPGPKGFPATSNLKIHERTFPAGNFKCVTRKDEMGEEGGYCFYPSTGGLAFRLGRLYIAEFADYRSFEDKSFPRKMSVLVRNKPSMVISVTKLEKLDQSDMTLFAPTIDAEKWPACDSPVPPQVLTPVLPLQGNVGPGSTFDQSGRMMTYIEIGKDGKIQTALSLEEDGSVSRTKPNPIVKEVRFGPATCNGSPIPWAMVMRHAL